MINYNKKYIYKKGLIYENQLNKSNMVIASKIKRIILPRIPIKMKSYWFEINNHNLLENWSFLSDSKCKYKCSSLIHCVLCSLYILETHLELCPGKQLSRTPIRAAVPLDIDAYRVSVKMNVWFKNNQINVSSWNR